MDYHITPDCIVREYVFFSKSKKTWLFTFFWSDMSKKHRKRFPSFRIMILLTFQYIDQIFIRLLQNIYGLSFRIEDNTTYWGWSSFRPETLSLYRPAIHLTTVTFFTFFYVFLNPKKRDFLRFFALLHTFSRTMATAVARCCRALLLRLAPWCYTLIPW